MRYMPNVELESNNRKENEEFSKKFTYSIGAGTISFGIIFITSNYFSAKYLSIGLKFGLFMFFCIFFIQSISFLLVIFMRGIYLTRLLERFRNVVRLCSNAFFDIGFFSLFISMCYHLPFFIVLALLLEKKLSSETFFLFYFIFSFILTLIYSKIFQVSIISYLRAFISFIRNRENIINRLKSETASILLVIIILFPAMQCATYISDATYDITIEISEKYYDDRYGETHFVVVKATGFASINFDTQRNLYTSSENLEKIPLDRFTDKLYYGHIPLSELENRTHFVTFSVGDISKSEIIIVDRISTRKNS